MAVSVSEQKNGSLTLAATDNGLKTGSLTLAATADGWKNGSLTLAATTLEASSYGAVTRAPKSRIGTAFVSANEKTPFVSGVPAMNVATTVAGTGSVPASKA